jgi:hypothetical protein
MVGLVHSFRGKKKRGPRAPAGEKNGKGLRHFSMKGQVFPSSTAELSNCKLNFGWICQCVDHLLLLLLCWVYSQPQ